MGYKFCTTLNMFCNDIEDEEVEMAQSVNQDCGGDCNHCECTEEVK